jgi:HEPN domain-containing protein
MIDREDAERLLHLAEIDLKALRNMLNPELFDCSVFGFHAQQAVEKALKCWLTLRRIAYPKTHDLRLLMNLLESRTQERARQFEGLIDLTDFAVQFRYDFVPDATEINRSDILVAVEDLIQHCRGLVQAARKLE